ncbi:MAG: hypothetical protein MI739_04600, partial [Bacteroidales bacterium]|nr:hypothetical protein [Bacteroidales bacterium]
LTERTYYNRKAIPTLNFPTAYSDTVIVNIDPAPTANAGNDTALCHNTAYHVQNADTSESSGVTWEILVGNGTLNNVNIIDPEYTPDPLNEVDTVQLVLHALGNGACIESTDTVKIIYASEFNVTIGKSTPFLIDSTSTHIDVALKVSNHHFVALLGFYLVSPLDSIVELKRICNLIGTSNLRDISCEFYNDSLSLPIVSPCHMTSGRYRFEDDWKRKLHGQDPANGNWRIMITDTLSLGSTGTLDSAVIRFIDNNSNSQLETVVYQDTSINLNINGYPGGHTDPPAITEYNLSITGLATLCYNTCDANVIATAIGGMPPYVSYVWSRDRDFSTVYVDNDTADLCSGKYYL